MRFWDSSAIVPLLVEEATTPGVGALLREDGEVLVWWATEVECASAIARLERQSDLAPESARAAYGRLDVLATGWHVVQPIDRIGRTARRLLRVHPLRAADSLQLAAALVAAEDDPGALALVSLDERLIEAAQREGFPIVAVAGSTTAGAHEAEGQQ